MTPRSDSPIGKPAQGHMVHDTARVQQVSQAAFVECRMRHSVAPPAVTGIDALLTQKESLQKLL